MDKKQIKRIKKYVSWILIVVIVALLAMMPLLARNKQEEQEIKASILAGSVTRGDIATTLVGGGTLASEKSEAVTIPEAVKLTEYTVKNGDIVKEGDVIAKVDRISVMTAITDVQEALEEIAEELDDISDDRQSKKLKTIAEATVKTIYAKEGEQAQEVMLRDGALAALSLDGLMAVQINRRTDLAGGDEVCVILDDDTEVKGRVETNLDGLITVTVKDDQYEPGQSVVVKSLDGDRIGSGTLYIHSQWNLIAYSGKISKIHAKAGDTVSADKTLITLEDTERTAEFESLSALHREYEEMLLELFKMYQSESILAACDGIVTGVDESGLYMLSAEGQWQVKFLANGPMEEAEEGYVNFVGQVWGVGLDGIVMKMNPQPLQINDYKDLSGVPMDPALMTEDVIYASDVPVFALSGEEWVQVDGASIAPGDILLFAGDAQGNFVWVIRLASQTPEEVPPTEPEMPTEPSAPTEPENPGDTEIPVDPSQPTEPGEGGESGRPSVPGQGSGQTPQFGGGMMSGMMGGMMGGMTQQQEEERYSLAKFTIANVVPQDALTLDITVDELDISKITLGQEADVTLDALMGRSFKAYVTAISTSGESSGGNSKFTVTLTLDKEADMLPGMSASAVITLAVEENVLTVPVAALVEQGKDTVLYTGYDAETETFLDPVIVTTGVSDGENVQILSGAEEGMEILYGYYDTLVVKPVPEMGMSMFG